MNGSRRVAMVALSLLVIMAIASFTGCAEEIYITETQTETRTETLSVTNTHLITTTATITSTITEEPPTPTTQLEDEEWPAALGLKQTAHGIDSTHSIPYCYTCHSIPWGHQGRVMTEETCYECHW